MSLGNSQYGKHIQPLNETITHIFATLKIIIAEIFTGIINIRIFHKIHYNHLSLILFIQFSLSPDILPAGVLDGIHVTRVILLQCQYLLLG